MDDTRFPDKKVIFLYAVLCCFTAGCAAAVVPSVGQEGYVLADDERRMRKRSDEMCEILDESGHIYQNPELEGYLTNFVNELLPVSVRQDPLTVKVKVINDPTLNAFAFPNGRIYVHTGMLAVIDNEAQLAALLSHEAAHALNRHALKQFRSLTNKSAFFAALQIPIAVMGGNLGALVAQMSMISSVSGYSQNLESEADREGFAMMLAKGYDPREAPKLFEHLRDFIKDEDVKQPFFFSTHPSVIRRIDNFNDLIAKEGQTIADQKKVEEASYKRHVRQLVLDDISLCLREGMFKTAQNLVDRYISENTEDAFGYFYRGELYRQRQDHDPRKKERDKNEDYPSALDAYDRAITHDPAFARAYREKARILQKLGRTDESKGPLRKYLELNPDAEDKEYVEQFLLSN